MRFRPKTATRLASRAGAAAYEEQKRPLTREAKQARPQGSGDAFQHRERLKQALNTWNSLPERSRSALIERLVVECPMLAGRTEEELHIPVFGAVWALRDRVEVRLDFSGDRVRAHLYARGQPQRPLTEDERRDLLVAMAPMNRAEYAIASAALAGDSPARIAQKVKAFPFQRAPAYSGDPAGHLSANPAFNWKRLAGGFQPTGVKVVQEAGKRWIAVEGTDRTDRAIATQGHQPKTQLKIQLREQGDLEVLLRREGNQDNAAAETDVRQVLRGIDGVLQGEGPPDPRYLLVADLLSGMRDRRLVLRELDALGVDQKLP